MRYIFFPGDNRVRRNKFEGEQLGRKTWSPTSLAGKGLSQV